MINRRFLNFETYGEFQSKLPEIPQDSIVFVQSKPCIWTHGKEYVCRGGDASVNGGVLSFTDDGNDVVFTIEQDNADLILRDSNGNYSKATYVLGSVFTDTITSLRSKDNEIINALNGKLGIDALTEYSKTSIIQGWLNNKQDKLTAGTGIAINQSTNTIYSTLDTEPYVIVQELPVEGNPNKIYLLETSTYQGVPKFEQWKYRINNNYNTFPIVLTDGQSEYVSGSWVQLGDVDLGVNLSLYAKREQLDALWDELTTKYATIQYVNDNYVTKVYADGTYIKQSDVYTPAQEGGVSGIIEDESQGGSSGSGSGGNVRIDVDSELSVVSMNPVENRAITLALRDKADSDDLRRYATLDSLQTKVDQSVLNSYADKTLVNSLLQTKQNVLTAGDGIRISNNVISSTVDTNVYVIVDELPQSDISDQKIYLLESTVDNETTYTEYRYKNGEWVEIGIKTPTIDMQLYLSKQEAAGIYQPIGSYVTQQTLNQFDTALRGDMANTYATLTYVNTELANYQLAGDYATTSDLTTLLNNIASIYATPSDLTSAIDTLRTWVTDNYVNKTEVHTPTQDSSQESDDIYTGNSSSTPSGGGGNQNPSVQVNNMVTLSTRSYQQLVDNDLVDPDTYYFTYEVENEPLGLGMFPINLT